MTINGTGLSETPGVIRLINGSGATTLSGAITASTASRINNDGTGLLTIGTAAFTNTGGISFGLNNTGGITVSSAISGNGALTKDGTGTGMLILGGANSYNGVTTISTGVVRVTHGTALGSTSGATSIAYAAPDAILVAQL